MIVCMVGVFFFQAEDGIRDWSVTGVQTCALPISYTPFFVNRLPDAAGVMVGAVVWLGAGFGIVLAFAWPHGHYAMKMALYLVMEIGRASCRGRGGGAGGVGGRRENEGEGEW